jgi:hypothetical protein
VRLEIALVDHRDPVGLLEDQVGLGERLGDVAARELGLLGDVDGLGGRRLGLGDGHAGVRERLAGVGLGAGVGHGWRSHLHGLQGIDGGRQDLVLHLDQVAGFLGDRRLVGGDGGDRLTGEDDPVDRQDRVRARRGLALELRNVPSGEHRAHAGQGPGARGIDPHDPGVGVGAAQQLGVKHPLGLDVGHVLHLSGDLLRPVRARDGQADPLHLARRLHHGHEIRLPWRTARPPLR